MKAQVRKLLRSLALRVPQIRVVHEQVIAANKTMADLRSMNERLRSTNAVVGVQLNEVSNEQVRTQRELNAVRAELAATLAAQPSRDRIESSAQELQDLRSQLSTLVGEFTQMNSAREQADEACYSLGKELDGAKAELAAAEAANIALRSELETAVVAARNTARIEELTLVLQRERARATALASDFSRLQRLVSTSQDENGRLAKQLAESQTAAAMAITSERDTALEQASELTASLDKVGKKLRQVEDRAEELGQRLFETQQDVRRRERELEAAEVQARDAAVSAESTKLQLSEAQAAVGQARSRICALEADVSQQLDELGLAHRQLAEETSLRTAAEQTASLECSRTEAALARVAALEALGAGQSAELVATQSQVARLRAESEAASARAQAAEARADEASKLAATVQVQLTDLSAQYGEAKLALAAERSNREEIRLRALELERALASYQAELLAGEAQVAELRAASEIASARAQAAEARADEASRLVSTTQGQLTELSARYALAEQNLATERMHAEEIKSRARDLERFIAKGQEDLQAAQAAHEADRLAGARELENLRAQAQEASRASDELQRLLGRQRQEMQVVELRADEMASAADEAARKLAEIEGRLGDASAAQARITALEGELAGQREALKAAEARRIAMQTEKDQLAFQLKVQMPETLARILGKISKAEDTFERDRKPAPRAIALYDPAAAAAGLRERYLDLLEGSLTGTLYEDAPISPWSKGYDAEVRSLGRDWPARALTMIGSTRMRNIRRVLEDVLERDVPGDFIETGVWRGGACIYARGILAAHGAKDRKVWVADSFKGLPPPSPDTYPEDRDDPHHTYEELRVSLNQVRQSFRDYGLLDDQVQFLKGWFSETLARAPIERLAVLRLDGDMYESTIQALDALYRKVSVGGYVIVDDYGLGPCKKAVDDFRAGLGIEDTILEIDGAAIYWRKTAAAETIGDRKLASVPKQV